MFPRANELNMVSDNGVSNSKDLKGVFTTITDSTSYPKTPYYMDKSTDRENSVTLPSLFFRVEFNSIKKTSVPINILDINSDTAAESVSACRSKSGTNAKPSYDLNLAIVGKNHATRRSL